jgi:hypothetical protein
VKKGQRQLNIGKLAAAAALRPYRELAVEAPESSLPPAYSVPEGMIAWKNAKNGFMVVACHYTADPEKRNDAWYTDACKNLREDQIERELEINFDSKAGAKAFPFLEHNEATYRRDPPRPIPENWKIVAGLDYGARNATSMHWYAIDEHRRFWAFDEFYTPMNQLKGGLVAFADYVKNHPMYPRLKFISADPSMFNRNQNVLTTKEGDREATGTLMSVADLLIKQGIHKLQRGNNDRLAGISRSHQMFNWHGDEKSSNPFFFIGRKCNKLWWEYINLVYKLDDNENKNADEDVVKRNDHAFDDSKYALLSQELPADAPRINPLAGFATLQNIEEEIDARYAKEDQDPFSCSFAEYEDEEDFAEMT